MALLRRAHRRHPDDFCVNFELGRALSEIKPPRLEEAIGYYRCCVPRGFADAGLAPPSAATANSALFRRANFRKRYHADGGHASTGSSFK